MSVYYTKVQTLSQELSTGGYKLVAIKCDVRKEEDILSMMSKIKSQFGGADICINNAGLAHNAPLLSGSTEMWREMLEASTILVVNFAYSRGPKLVEIMLYKVLNFCDFQAPKKQLIAWKILHC